MLSAILFLHAALAAPTIELTRPGFFHGDEMRSVEGETWWGLFADDEGASLRKVEVGTWRTADPVVGDVIGEPTGVQVVAPGTPVALIRGLDLEEGAVSTVLMGETLLLPGERLGLPRPGAVDLLLVTGSAEAAAWSPVEPIFEDYAFTLVAQVNGRVERGQELLRISELGGEGSPTVRWAGDLDRDGRMDLIIDATDHYNVERLVLYLSSKAGPGEIVGRVAERLHVGC